MDFSFVQQAMHSVSQGLTYPVIIALLLFICYALYCIGSVLVEYFIEHKYFQVETPRFLRAMTDAKPTEMSQIVKESGMLLRQKKLLLTLFDNRDLPDEALWALAKKLLISESEYYKSKVGKNDMAAKIAPMLGLMGTLIPLGPGIVALGGDTPDTAILANALQIAFDTTVSGLIVAIICLIISKVRRKWYAQYNAALEAAVTTMLEKIDSLKEDGALSMETKMDMSGLDPKENKAKNAQAKDKKPSSRKSSAENKNETHALADEAKNPASEGEA